MERGWIVRDPEALPPPDARLIAYGEKIDTPVDERGLIDTEQLIADVKACVDPTYTWSDELSVHHFYWPSVYYPYTHPNARLNPHRFRNLPVHKGLMPRDFENFLHLITQPPEIPDDEVMIYRVQAWFVASDLFKTARKTLRWEKLAQKRRQRIAENPQIIARGFNGQDELGEEIMHETFEKNFRNNEEAIREISSKNFRGLEKHFRRLERIPPEFRLADPTDTPKELTNNLGRLVTRGSANLVSVIKAA